MQPIPIAPCWVPQAQWAPDPASLEASIQFKHMASKSLAMIKQFTCVYLWPTWQSVTTTTNQVEYAELGARQKWATVASSCESVEMDKKRP